MREGQWDVVKLCYASESLSSSLWVGDDVWGEREEVSGRGWEGGRGSEERERNEKGVGCGRKKGE